MPEAQPPNNVRPLRPELVHALDAEQAVLGAMFLEHAAYLAVRDLLSADDFYLRPHQLIYGACCELVEDGRPIDPILVLELLEAKGLVGREVPADLPFTLARGLGTAGNVAHYAKLIVDAARVRRVQLAAQRVLERSRDAGRDAEAFLAFARASLGEFVEVAKPPKVKRIPLIHARDAQEKPVEWVIENFLARGELTDLSGDPGVGKGGITASWAARVTREDPTATVIFFATEDPLGRVKARLRAEGADLSRVLFLDITRSDASPILPDDADAVEAVVREHNAALLILDPALEFMQADLDSHRQQDVARFMGPLLGIAMRTNAALLTVRHNNKNTGASALHRASGSIGFIGKVRIALTAAKDNETGTRALAVSKNNLGADKFTVGYDVLSRAGASVIAWGEVLATSADELVNQEPKKRAGRPPAKLEAAVDALRGILAAGPMKIDDVLRCTGAERIGRTTVYEAAKVLKLERVTVEVRPAWRLPFLPESGLNHA